MVGAERRFSYVVSAIAVFTKADVKSVKSAAWALTAARPGTNGRTTIAETVTGQPEILRCGRFSSQLLKIARSRTK
jgi:hypothetical protein